LNAQTDEERLNLATEYADGDFNAELKICATLSGLELSLGPVVSWAWILAARETLLGIGALDAPSETIQECPSTLRSPL